jgi:phosphate uptake regulator
MTTRNPVFAAKLKTDLIESNAMIAVSKALERIADHASRIAHATEILESSRAPEGLLERLEGLANDAIALLDSSVEAFFTKDSVEANSCIEGSNGLRRKVATFVEDATRQKGNIAVGLSFIAESVDRVGGYSSDIAEIAINLAQ